MECHWVMSWVLLLLLLLLSSIEVFAVRMFHRIWERVAVMEVGVESEDQKGKAAEEEAEVG